MLNQRDIEGIADVSVSGAGFDLCVPPDAIKLARRIVGPVRTMPECALPGDAVLARVGGERRIYVRGKLPPLRLRWAVLHECAEALLDASGYRETDVETVADRLAASLGVPRAAAIGAFRRPGGPNWTQLALEFRTSESCAALRYGEVTGHPVALVTTGSVRARGEPMPWPSTDDLRSPKRLPGLVRARLRDDKSRVVVRAAG